MLFLETAPHLTGRVGRTLSEQLHRLHAVLGEILLPGSIGVDHEAFAFVVRIAHGNTVANGQDAMMVLLVEAIRMIVAQVGRGRAASIGVALEDIVEVTSEIA